MDSLLIRDVTVFTGTGNLFLEGSVLLEKGRIKAVGRNIAAQKDTAVLEGCGRFLMAGFIDAHAHLALVDVPERPELHPDAPYMAAHHAALKLSSGVTTVRDMGGLLHVDLALRRAIQRGQVPGPRMICSGQVISPTGGHIHYFAREADGPSEIRKAAREQIKAGADILKIMVSGGIANVGEDPDKLHMHEDEVREVVAVAKEQKTVVAAHIYPSRGIQMAARCGVTSIEHAVDLDDQAITTLVQTGAWAVPTHCVYKHMAANAEKRISEEMAELAGRVYETKSLRLKEAVRAGVRIGVGTDCGRHFPPSDFKSELMLLHEAGMSTEGVLLASTIGNAKLLGLASSLGTVEVGKIADLVLLKGNPIDDLEKAGEVEKIIQGGQVLDPSALMKRGLVIK